jgi:hypothetical protein
VTQDLHVKDLKERDQKYETDFAKLKKKFHQTLAVKNAEVKKVQTELESEKQELFENESALTFMKDMKFFKRQWQAAKSKLKHKKIAAAMANATKAWVSDEE